MHRLAQTGIHRKLVMITGDGNCLYKFELLSSFVSYLDYTSCLAVGCGRPEADEAFFREIVAREIETHPEKYRTFLTEPLQTILAKVRNPGQWARDIEISAFKEAMQIKVTLYKNGMPKQEFVPFSGNIERELEIAFVNENHFDLLVEEAIHVDMQCMHLEEPINQQHEENTALKDAKKAEAIRQALFQTGEVIAKLEPDHLEQRTLTELLQGPQSSREKTVKWLEDLGVFPQEYQCPKEGCGGMMRRRPSLQDRADGDWYCQKCQTRRTIRQDTIFRVCPPNLLPRSSFTGSETTLECLRPQKLMCAKR